VPTFTEVDAGNAMLYIVMVGLPPPGGCWFPLLDLEHEIQAKIIVLMIIAGKKC